MGECCYTIKQIPDLTLGKYDYLSHNGVEGVLELHRVLLRQLHEKSYLTGVTLHLLYCYQHDGAPGNKIRIYFLARGKDSMLSNIHRLLNGTTLSEYFHFSFLYRQDDSGRIVESREKDAALITPLQEKTFSCCSVLTKEEVFFEARDGKTYYNVPTWKPNSEGRLYDMLRIMNALDEDFVYRIDIRAVKRNRVLREKLTGGPIPRLHALQSTTGERDYGADTILRAYEDMMKSLDSQPHFEVHTFVFSNNPEDGAMVMASAASEAIGNGDYAISSYMDTDPFTCKSLLDGDQKTYYSLKDDFILKRENGKIKTYSCKLEESGWLPLYYLSTLYTLDELEPFFRLPCLHDGEHIEIPKETVAPSVDGKEVLYLGRDSHGYPVNIPLELLPKHAFLSGVPGSGKTNAMHHLTHSLWSREKPIPFLVLEPAKKEYRALLNLPEMKDVRLFSPCSNMSFPLHINPFEFPKGLSVSEHIRTLCSVFEGAFPLDNPMPFLLENAIETVYKKMGWHPETVYNNKTDLKFPTMSMLYKELEKELKSTTYSSEVRGNLESALKVRIGSLLRREMGDVFDVSKSSLSPEEWLTTPAIVELESMGQGPANFTTLMLCALIRECLKVNPTYNGPVRHVIFIEEAHNLIGPDSEEKSGGEANAKAAATAFIVKMLAEVRALKEGIFIADQLPTAMAAEVIKNTGLKIGLRLTAMDDRQLLCNSMSANSSQIEDMGNFSIGQALVSYEKLQRPFKMRVNLWCGDKGETERKRLATSLPDAPLVQNLQSNLAFRDNLVRSVNIEFGKLFDATNRIAARHEECLQIVSKIKAAKQRYDDLLQQQSDLCDRMTQILIYRYDNDRDQAMEDVEYFDALVRSEDMNGKILECSREIAELGKSLQQAQCRAVINETLELCRIIRQKRNRFIKLGLSPTPAQEAAFMADPSSVDPGISLVCAMRSCLIQNLLDYASMTYLRTKNYCEFPDSQRLNIIQAAKFSNIQLSNNGSNY